MAYIRLETKKNIWKVVDKSRIPDKIIKTFTNYADADKYRLSLELARTTEKAIPAKLEPLAQEIKRV